MKELADYLNNLKNYEKSGVPKGAGTDSNEGFDLGRMRRLMKLLENPQSNFKSIHIAGTKGKGSTAAFLSNILRAEGYSVGCYTSPHILTIRERISVGKPGEPVSVKTLNSLFLMIKKVLDQAVQLEGGRLSHFEAGLGGARDATNVICSSDLAAAILTTVGAEHLDALGSSLESIVIAKSGIIKNGRPVWWFFLIFLLNICIIHYANSNFHFSCTWPSVFHFRNFDFACYTCVSVCRITWLWIWDSHPSVVLSNIQWDQFMLHDDFLRGP